MKGLKFSKRWIGILILAVSLLVGGSLAAARLRIPENVVLTVNGLDVTEEEYLIFYEKTRSGIPEGKTREEVTLQFVTEYKAAQQWAMEMGIPVIEDFDQLKQEWEKETVRRNETDIVYGKEQSFKEYFSSRYTQMLYEMKQNYLKIRGAEDVEESEKILQEFEEELEQRIQEAEIKWRKTK